jgi:hypothetical protein
VVPDLPSSLANPCPPPFRYWDSTEAKVLSNARENEADALEAIKNQLKLLCPANDAPNGRVLLIEEQDDELLEKNVRTPKMDTKTKILFLTCALNNAKMQSKHGGIAAKKQWRQQLALVLAGSKTQELFRDGTKNFDKNES